MHETTPKPGVAPVVTLALPAQELRDWRDRKEGREFFDRGERLILVNGVRWGRTRVTYHGCHGTKHTLCQDGDGPVIENPGAKYERESAVRSVKFRRWTGEPQVKTEDLVIAKAAELVAAGRLRDPATVRREHAEAAKLYREQQERGAAREESEFRTKAAEAIGANDLHSEAVDRVLAAMRWAQTQ